MTSFVSLISFPGTCAASASQFQLGSELDQAPILDRLAQVMGCLRIRKRRGVPNTASSSSRSTRATCSDIGAQGLSDFGRDRDLLDAQPRRAFFHLDRTTEHQARLRGAVSGYLP